MIFLFIVFLELVFVICFQIRFIILHIDFAPSHPSYNVMILSPQARQIRNSKIISKSILGGLYIIEMNNRYIHA